MVNQVALIMMIHIEFSQLLEAAFRRVKGFYDYLCQEEIEKHSCLLGLTQVYCIELCNIPALSKKKKRARGTKTLLKRFYRHRANGDSQRQKISERYTVKVTFVLVFNSFGIAAAILRRRKRKREASRRFCSIHFSLCIQAIAFLSIEGHSKAAL